MSGYSIAQVKCDGDGCDAQELSHSRRQSLLVSCMRKVLSSDGWENDWAAVHGERQHDLCPECVAKRGA